MASSPVLLFISFEAARSSRTTRVLVPSKEYLQRLTRILYCAVCRQSWVCIIAASKARTLGRRSVVCCIVSDKEAVKGHVIGGCWEDEHDVIELATERATMLVSVEPAGTVPFLS